MARQVMPDSIICNRCKMIIDNKHRLIRTFEMQYIHYEHGGCIDALMDENERLRKLLEGSGIDVPEYNAVHSDGGDSGVSD